MSSRKRKTNKNKNISSKEKDIKIIFNLFLSIIFLFAVYTNLTGTLSIFVQRNIYSYIGILTYIIPIFTIYYCLEQILHKYKYIKRSKGIILILVSLYLFCGTLYIQMNNQLTLKEMIDYIYNFDNTSLHSGIIGSILTFPMSKLVGLLGSYLIEIFIAIMGIMISLNTSIIEVIDRKSKKVKKHKQKNIKDKYNLKVNNNSNISKSTEIIDIIIRPTKSEEKLTKKIEKSIPNIDLEDNSKIKNKSYTENNVELNIIEKTDNNQIINNKLIINESPNNNLVDNKLNDNIYRDLNHELPPIDLLEKKQNISNNNLEELKDKTNSLERVLNDFGVKAHVIKITKGPSVTRFELQLEPGVKVSKILNLQDDIALALAAGGIRIEAPIPGKSAVGIEVPNKTQVAVHLSEIISSEEFKNSKDKVSFALGKDINGDPVVGDIGKMPHLLIAGATGSGKSVCINSLIVSILYKYTPNEVKLLMIDPKVVELSVYNGIPHLLAPVITEPQKASKALLWAIKEMNKRYAAFFTLKVKSIETYNKLAEKNDSIEKLPFIVIIIDELADLMMTCSKEVEDYITRLAQMARAAGIHLVIATQRPSTDVITGLIKSNIPSRISFAVSSSIDSRTILDSIGAEKLLGKGDMLYHPTGMSKAQRIQGTFISEEEVDRVINFFKVDEIENEKYEKEVIDCINETSNNSSNSSLDGNDKDELLEEAIKIAIEAKQISVSFLQRRLRIGFNRASRIVDELEQMKVIGPRDGVKAREVLIRNIEELKISN